MINTREKRKSYDSLTYFLLALGAITEKLYNETWDKMLYG